MAKKQRQNQKKRTNRRQRGVVGNALGYIPGLGGILKPVIGGIEDAIVGANSGKKKGISRSGRTAAAISRTSSSSFTTYMNGSEMHVVGKDLV